MTSRTPSQQTLTAASTGVGVGLVAPPTNLSYPPGAGPGLNSNGAIMLFQSAEATATHAMDGMVRGIEMATDRTAWTAEHDGSIRIRALPSGNVVKVLERKGKNIFCNCLLLVDGKIWAAYSDGFLRRYDAKSAALEREVLQHDGAVYALHSIAGRVYSAGQDWKLYQWSSSSVEYQRQFYGHTNSVRCLSSSATTTTHGGSLLFSGSDDATVRAWDPYAPLQSSRDIACVATMKGHTKSVLTLESVADRRQLWSGSEDHSIRVWSTETFQCVGVLERHRAPVAALALVETRVWSGGKDGTLFLWDAKSLTPIQALQEGIQVSSKYVMCVKRLYRAHYFKVWTSTSDGFLQSWNVDVNHGLTEGFEILTAEETIARKRDQARIEGLQAALYEHGAQLHAKEDEIQELQHRIEVLKDPSQNVDLVALSGQCDELGRSLEETARQRDQLATRCQMADDLLQATRLKLKASEARCSDLESENGKLRSDASEVVTLRRTTEQQQIEIRELERTIQKQRDEMLDLQRAAENLEDAVRSHQHLFADNHRLQAEVSAIEESLRSERTVNHALQQQILALTLSRSATAGTSSTTPKGPRQAASVTAHTSPSPSSSGGAKASPSQPKSANVAGSRGGHANRRSTTSSTNTHHRSTLISRRLTHTSTTPRRHELDDSFTSSSDEHSYVAAEAADEVPLTPGEALFEVDEATSDETPAPRRDEPPKPDTPRGLTFDANDRLESLRLENRSLTERLEQLAIKHELDAAALHASRNQEMASQASLAALKVDSSKTIGELRASLKLAQSELAHRSAEFDSELATHKATFEKQRKELSKKEEQLMDLRDALSKLQSAADASRRSWEERLAQEVRERESIKRQLTDARRERERAEKLLLVGGANRGSRSSSATSGLQQQQPQPVPQPAECDDDGVPQSQHDLAGGSEAALASAGANTTEQELAAEVTLLRGRLEEMEDERVHHERRAAEALSKLAETESARDRDSVAVAALQLDNEQLRRLLTVAAQEKASMQTQMEGLEERHDDARHALREALVFLQTERERYEQLQSEFNELRLHATQSNTDAATRHVQLEQQDPTERAALTNEANRDEAETDGASATGSDGFHTPRDDCAAAHAIIEELEDALSVKEQELRHREEAIQLLQAQVARVKLEAHDAKQTMEASRTACLEAAESRYVAEMEEMQREHAAAQAERTLEHEERIRRLESRLVEALDNVASLSGALDSVSASRVTLEEELKRQQRVVSGLEAALHAKEAEVQRLVDSRTELEHQLESKRVDDVSLQQRPRVEPAATSGVATEDDACVLELIKVNRSVLDLETAHSKQKEMLEAELRGKEAMLERLLDSYKGLERQLESSRAEVAALQRDRQVLQEQLLAAEQSTVQAVAELHEVERDAMLAASSLRDLSARTEQLQTEVLSSRGDAEAALNETLHEYEERLEKALTAQQLADRALELSDARNHEWELKEQRAREERDEALKRVSSLTSEIAAARDALDRVKQSLDEARTEHALTLQRQMASDAQLRTLTSAMEDEKRLATEATRREDVLQSQMDALVTSNSELATSLRNLESIRDNLQSELRQCEHAKAARDARDVEQREELDRLKLVNEEERATAHHWRQLAESADERLRGAAAALEALRSTFSATKLELCKTHEDLASAQATARDAAVARDYEVTRAVQADMEAKEAIAALQLAVKDMEEKLALQTQLQMSAEHTSNELRLAVVRLETERDTASASVTAEVERHSQTKAQLRDVHAATETLRGQLVDCHTALSEVRRQLDDSERTAQKLRASHETDVAVLQGSINELTSQRSRLHDEVKEHELNHQRTVDALKATVQELDEARRACAQREEEASALKEQLQRANVYIAELEATVHVVKQTLDARKHELEARQSDADELRARLTAAEQERLQLRHRVSEAGRERAELLRLRDVTADQTGAVDAANEENKMLVDQLTSLEDSNERLQLRLHELESHLEAFTRTKERATALEESQAQLCSELERVRASLLSKSDEALSAAAAQDKVNYLNGRLEEAVSNMERLKSSHDETVRDLEGVIRTQEDKIAAEARHAEACSRALRETEARLNVITEDYHRVANDRDGLVREQMRLSELVKQFESENRVLSAQLTAVRGSVEAQAELESASRQWEFQMDQWREQATASASTISQLQQALEAEQALLVLLLSESSTTKTTEQWMREVAALTAKCKSLDAAVVDSQHATMLAHRQNEELRARIRLLERCVAADGVIKSLEHVSQSAAMPLVDSRGNSCAVGRSSADPDEPVSGLFVTPAEGDVTQDDVTVEFPPGTSDMTGLVPTPQPTPRLHLASHPHPHPHHSQHAQQHHPNHVSIVNRRYTEHLAATIRKYQQLVEQLSSANLQRAETQRILTERLQTVRGLVLQRATSKHVRNSNSSSVMGVLLDDAVTQRIAQLEALVAAQRRRLQHVAVSQLEAKSHTALMSLRGGDADDATHAEAVAAVEDVMSRKAQVIAELTADRDAARAEVAKKARTLALLADGLIAMQRGSKDVDSDGGSSSSQLKSLVALGAEEVSKETTRLQMEALLQRLRDVEVMSLGEDEEGRLARALEDNATLLAQVHAHELAANLHAKEAAEWLLTSAEQQDRRQTLQQQLAARDIEIERLKNVSLVTQGTLTQTQAQLAEAVQTMESLRHELTVKQRRRDELVLWVRQTAELQPQTSALSNEELFDTLTVCRQLYAMYTAACDELKRFASAQGADGAGERTTLAATEANELRRRLQAAEERAENLVFDVRSAMDEAAEWQGQCQSLRDDLSRASKACAESQSTQHAAEAALALERTIHGETQRRCDELHRNLEAAHESMQTLQQQLRESEHRVQDAEMEFDALSQTLQLKTTLMERASSDTERLMTLLKGREVEVQEAQQSRMELERALVATQTEEAALRHRCGVLEAKVQALEDRYEAEIQLSSSTRARLEGSLQHMRSEHQSTQRALVTSESVAARVEGLERDIASLTKRLALSQELCGHLKEQNAVLERHRVESTSIRSKLGTTAADLAQLRRLCVEGFGILPAHAEERPVSAYVTLLEQHAEQLAAERTVFGDVQSSLEGVVSELTAARHATRHLSNAAAEDEMRANLSLAPSFAADGPSPSDVAARPSWSDVAPPDAATALSFPLGASASAPLPPTAPIPIAAAASVAPSSRSVSPSLPSSLRTAADMLPWMDRLRSLSKSITAQHWSLVETVRAQKVKLVQLADNNKNLSEEIDQLSNKMKHAASKLVRTENTEQLLTFMEPSRDIAVRSLFRLRDIVSEMKVRLTMLHGTVAQTKPHWVELYRHLTMETEPLRAGVQQAQGLLTYAFDRCLTMREKEELLDQHPPTINASSKPSDGSTGQWNRSSAGGNPPMDPPAADALPPQTPRSSAGGNLFNGLATVLPGQDPSTYGSQQFPPAVPPSASSYATPSRAVTTGSAIIGLGDSAVHRELVARGIQEARRREQMRADADRQ